MHKRIVLSHPISNQTPTYGNKGNISIEKVSSVEVNGSSSLNLDTTNHISTHIDFPAHFCKDGKTLSDYDDEFWFFQNVGFIEASLDEFTQKLDTLSADIEILLLKTNFERYRGTNKYMLEQEVIDKGLASTLRQKFPKLRVFGFDMISVSSYQNREMGRAAHKTFLCENDILLLEDMKLSGLTQTPNSLVVAPLLLEKADGTPCFVYATLGEEGSYL